MSSYKHLLFDRSANAFVIESQERRNAQGTYLVSFVAYKRLQRRVRALAILTIAIVALAFFSILTYFPLEGYRFSRAASTYYVDDGGDDMGGANNCLAAGSPCATITNALSYGDVAGNTIYINNGTYSEAARMRTVNQLTIIGESEAGVIIGLSSAATQIFSIAGDGSVISNLTLDGTNVTAGNGVLDLDSLNGATVSNITIINLSGAESKGVYARQSGPSPTDNALSDITITSIPVSANGIMFDNPINCTLNNYLAYNTSWQESCSGGECETATGIAVVGRDTATVASSITINNALMYNISGIQAGIFGSDQDMEFTCNNCQVYNAASSADDAMSISAVTMMSGSGSVTMNVYNSIIMNSDSGIVAADFQENGITTTSNYNLLYGNDATANYAGVNATVTPGAEDYCDLDNDIGCNNTAEDPDFVGTDCSGGFGSANCFTLNTDSPAIDVGDPTDSYSNEHATLHGDRINIGAYGNTSFATATSKADTFYVDAVNGSDSYDGSAVSLTAPRAGAKATIGACLRLVNDSGTCNIMDGTYAELDAGSGSGVYINTNNITLAGESEDGVIITSSGTTNIIEVNWNRDGVTIQDLTINCSPIVDLASYCIFGKGPDMTISNVTINNLDGAVAGISLWGGGANSVSNVSLYNDTKSAVSSGVFLAKAIAGDVTVNLSNILAYNLNTGIVNAFITGNETSTLNCNNCTAYNNTIDYRAYTLDHPDFPAPTGTAVLNVTNSIAAGSGWGMVVANDDGGTATGISNYNLFYGNSNDYGNVTAGANDYQGSTAFAPSFVDVDSGNFALAAYSNAIKKGQSEVDLGYYDFDGDRRTTIFVDATAVAGDYVVGDTSKDFADIASAVAAAVSGDTISVYAGTYSESSTISVPSGITLQKKSGESTVTIDGSGISSGPVISFSGAADSSVSGFTISDHNAVLSEGWRVNFTPFQLGSTVYNQESNSTCPGDFGILYGDNSGASISVCNDNSELADDQRLDGENAGGLDLILLTQSSGSKITAFQPTGALGVTDFASCVTVLSGLAITCDAHVSEAFTYDSGSDTWTYNGIAGYESGGETLVLASGMPTPSITYGSGYGSGSYAVNAQNDSTDIVIQNLTIRSSGYGLRVADTSTVTCTRCAVRSSRVRNINTSSLTGSGRLTLINSAGRWNLNEDCMDIEDIDDENSSMWSADDMCKTEEEIGEDRVTDDEDVDEDREDIEDIDDGGVDDEDGSTWSTDDTGEPEEELEDELEEEADLQKLVKVEGLSTVYLIFEETKEKKFFHNEAGFRSYGHSFDQVETISPEELLTYTSADPIFYSEDSVVKFPMNAKVYQVTGDNALKWIPTEEEFKAAGYEWGDIYDLSDSDYSSFEFTE